MPTTQITQIQANDEAVLLDIEAAEITLDKVGINVVSATGCGNVTLYSTRTGKSQVFPTINAIDYVKMITLAGPAFIQLVSIRPQVTPTKIPWGLFLQSVAISISTLPPERYGCSCASCDSSGNQTSNG